MSPCTARIAAPEPDRADGDRSARQHVIEGAANGRAQRGLRDDRDNRAWMNAMLSQINLCLAMPATRSDLAEFSHLLAVAKYRSFTRASLELMNDLKMIERCLQ